MMEYFPGCDGSQKLEVLSSMSYGCGTVEHWIAGRLTPGPVGPDCGRFPASSLFLLEDDRVVGKNKLGLDKMNYWLAEDQKVGPEQGFTLDLGCSKKAVGVRLKNTHNYKWADRSTKKFRLLGSNSVADGPWKTILEANLEVSMYQKNPPVQQLPLDFPMVLRFVKFELLEFWGKGGGLQYFVVQTEDDASEF